MNVDKLIQHVTRKRVWTYGRNRTQTDTHTHSGGGGGSKREFPLHTCMYLLAQHALSSVHFQPQVRYTVKIHILGN